MCTWYRMKWKVESGNTLKETASYLLHMQCYFYYYKKQLKNILDETVTNDRQLIIKRKTRVIFGYSESKHSNSNILT